MRCHCGTNYEWIPPYTARPASDCCARGIGEDAEREIKAISIRAVQVANALIRNGFGSESARDIYDRARFDQRAIEWRALVAIAKLDAREHLEATKWNGDGI
jgi:hypothetical protein